MRTSLNLRWSLAQRQQLFLSFSLWLSRILLQTGVMLPRTTVVDLLSEETLASTAPYRENSDITKESQNVSAFWWYSVPKHVSDYDFQRRSVDLTFAFKLIYLATQRPTTN
jgi:hypothetical protein